MINKANTADVRVSKQILPKLEELETVTEMGCRNISYITHMLHYQSVLSSYLNLYFLSGITIYLQ